MSSLSVNAAAREVLRSYPADLVRGTCIALGNHGGFSGAALWRLQTGTGMLCLRAWPPGNPSPDRLKSIHSLMAAARRAGLVFVPMIFATGDGATRVEHQGRLWEATTWMPGAADFHAQPRPERLRAALTALAQLHRVWSPAATTGPCPAVRRRLELVRRWNQFTATGWHPACLADKNDPVRPWAERAWRLLPTRVAAVPPRLAAWTDRSLSLQPCLCDIWHDHVLFAGDALSGIVDFGSIKTDHVAVDLARLLGSLVGCDLEMRTIAVEAYSQVRALNAEERELIDVLDETGTVLGAANWLLWLYRDEKPFEDRSAVARRLAELVRRLEAFG